MQNELQRRLDIIRTSPPDPMGAFTRVELALSAASAVALPWGLWWWLT